MANKKQERSARKNQRGMNLGRKLGNPAKAGRRRGPISRGPHVTSEWDRKRGAYLSSLGLSFYVRPEKWIDRDAKQTS